MVDIASIVIAVISSLGTLILGVAGFIYTRSSDSRKARSEAEKLIAKYRDPLLLASHDLQSRLFNIVDHNITNWLHGTSDEKESLRLYTAFLVGQYLSWTHILRRQVQFLRFSTDRNEKNQKLVHVFEQITSNFSSDNPAKGLSTAPFRLWRNQQMAIGEVMTVSEGSELYCMGSAAFFHRYKQGLKPECLQEELSCGTTTTSSSPPPPTTACSHPDDLAQLEPSGGLQISNQEFRNWLRPLIFGVNVIASAATKTHPAPLPTSNNPTIATTAADDDDDDSSAVPDERMRRLQHLLLDLMEIIDVDYYSNIRDPGNHHNNNSRCHRARICECTKCRGSQACPCDVKRKNACRYSRDQPGGSSMMMPNSTKSTTAGREELV